MKMNKTSFLLAKNNEKKILNWEIYYENLLGVNLKVDSDIYILVALHGSHWLNFAYSLFYKKSHSKADIFMDWIHYINLVFEMNSRHCSPLKNKEQLTC